jgi:hypothetical protein
LSLIGVALTAEFRGVPLEFSRHQFSHAVACLRGCVQVDRREPDPQEHAVGQRHGLLRPAGKDNLSRRHRQTRRQPVRERRLLTDQREQIARSRPVTFEEAGLLVGCQR